MAPAGASGAAGDPHHRLVLRRSGPQHAVAVRTGRHARHHRRRPRPLRSRGARHARPGGRLRRGPHPAAAHGRGRAGGQGRHRRHARPARPVAAAAAPWFRPRGAGANPGRGHRRGPGRAVRGHALRLGRRAVRAGAAGRGAIAGRRRGRPPGGLARLDRGTAGRRRSAGAMARRGPSAADRHRFAAQDRQQEPGLSRQVRAQRTLRRLARERRWRRAVGAAPGRRARYPRAAIERCPVGSAGRAVDDAGAGGGAIAPALCRHGRGRFHRDLAARRLGAGQRRRSGRAAAQARRVHPPPADRRIPGHQPDAARSVENVDLRLAGGRRPQPVPGGRSDAVDLPFPQGGGGAVP